MRSNSGRTILRVRWPTCERPKCNWPVRFGPKWMGPILHLEKCHKTYKLELS